MIGVVDVWVAYHVGLQTILGQGVVQILVFKARGDEVPAGCVVYLWEADVEIVKQSVRVHAAVVNDFGDTVIFQHFAQPNNKRIINTFTQHIEDEAVLARANLYDADAALATQIHALDIKNNTVDKRIFFNYESAMDC